MKTILTLLFIVITFTFSSYSQEIFIYGENGEKIYLQKIDSILQIKFKENTDNLEMIRTARTVNPNMAVSIVPINNRIIVPVKDIQFDKEELKMNNSICLCQFIIAERRWYYTNTNRQSIG